MKTPLVFVTCPLCGANDNKLRFSATNILKDKDPGYFNCTNDHLGEYSNNIVKCNNCHMIFANPQPDPENLISLYKDVEDPRYLEETDARIHTFKLSLKQMQKYIKPPGRLLDVGCYTGVFMTVAKNNGWEVSGIELSSWAANIAKKSNIGTIYNTPIEKLSLSRNTFDIITLWDVIEHLSKPKENLMHAVRLLKPDGVIALSTHMIDSLSAKILGKRYPFLMDMHLSHFSHTTIKQVLNDVGLEIIKIFPHKRILRTGYFLDKLSTKIPIGKTVVKKISKNKWISNRFVQIGFLGLKNIYCRKIR